VEIKSDIPEMIKNSEIVKQALEEVKKNLLIMSNDQLANLVLMDKKDLEQLQESIKNDITQSAGSAVTDVAAETAKDIALDMAKDAAKKVVTDTLGKKYGNLFNGLSNMLPIANNLINGGQS
jgi:hypothetical protein